MGKEEKSDGVPGAHIRCLRANCDDRKSRHVDGSLPNSSFKFTVEWRWSFGGDAELLLLNDSIISNDFACGHERTQQIPHNRAIDTKISKVLHKM